MKAQMVKFAVFFILNYILFLSILLYPDSKLCSNHSGFPALAAKVTFT